MPSNAYIPNHGPLLVMTACLAALLCSVADGQTQIGSDDFDGGGVYLSRSFSPDLSGTVDGASGLPRPGTFPDSRFDVFGIVDRTVNFDFADDSAGSFTPDVFGILKTGDTGKVLGLEDTSNINNSDPVIATWTFDITGKSGLQVSIDFAAMGDFENFRPADDPNFPAGQDYVNITASIDGGVEQPLFISFVKDRTNNGGVAFPYQYVMESGTVVALNDPIGINGVLLDNNFQTFDALVEGSGTTLTLRLEGVLDSGSEVVAVNNLRVFAVPEPASVLLMTFGGLWLCHRRRACSISTVSKFRS